jgi:RNA polymerase sigma-70 factor, ECF subfamily
LETQHDGGSFEDVWRAHRPFLIDLAFRMLGNIGDAEDVVQDAFSRLLQVDVEKLDDVRGWLVVVVGRMCLDVLRSARVRHDVGSDAASDVAAQPDGAGESPDPADRVTLDDNVRTALLVVLEKLSPAERAVFVLHDVFRYPFEEIASIVGRPADSCRKLASRARQRVATAGGPARFAVEPAEHRVVAQQFIAACAGGDLEALMRLLDADVAGQVDFGEGMARAPVQVGRHRVARLLLLYFGAGSGVTLVSQPLNGWPGAFAFKDGRLHALLVLETRDGLITDIHASRNPRMLASVGRMVEARR